MAVATETIENPARLRQPSEDIGACTVAVMAIMDALPPATVGTGVTAGWVEDRGCGFTEYAIGCALRKLQQARKVARTTDGTFVFWSLPDPARERKDATRKRREKFGSRLE
jgi:hypothetical protein